MGATEIELKFDKMEYDTTLAKNFLSQHQDFVGFNCDIDRKRKATNSVGKVIYLNDPSKGKTSYKRVQDPKKKLRNLSQLIVENVGLFCQLEYMVRGTKPEELKAFDLKLIIQNLLYCSSEKHQTLKSDDEGKIYVKNDSPLVRLACFAQKALESHQSIHIVSEVETAVVCWFFVTLCIKAGFSDVSLSFMEDISINKPEYLLEVQDSNNGGSIAVITGKADIDSAIDVLVDAPLRAPWGVRRVLVQENVLDRFRTALKGKASVCPGEVDETLSQRSTGAYAVSDKTFLIEYAGEASDKGIFVEAYRTVKELLSLIGKSRPLALSVWCDSVSESNEIAHNVTCNVIWVNTYGELNGPPQVCKGFLAKSHTMININVSDQFKRVRSVWEKMDTSERAAKLADALMEHKVTDANDSFYWVNGRITCAGVEKAAGTLAFRQGKTPINDTVPQLLMYLLKGGAIVFLDCDEALSGFCKALENAGAPVEETKSVIEGSDFPAYADPVCHQKLIWTSYGTIFAN